MKPAHRFSKIKAAVCLALLLCCWPFPGQAQGQTVNAAGNSITNLLQLTTGGAVVTNLTNGAYQWTGSTGTGYVLQDTTGSGNLTMAPASGGSSETVIFAGQIRNVGSFSTSANIFDPFNGFATGSASNDGIAQYILTTSRTIKHIGITWPYPASTGTNIIVGIRSNGVSVLLVTNTGPVNGSPPYPVASTNAAVNLFLPAGTLFDITIQTSAGTSSPGYLSWYATGQ
jgi:hypothetical protein